MRRLLIVSLLLTLAAILAVIAEAQVATPVKFDSVTDTGFEDFATSVAVSGTVAISAEFLGAPGGFNLRVSARNTENGSIIWQDVFPASGSAFVVQDATRSFVVTANPAGQFITRGYTTTTGQVLWTNTLTLELNRNNAANAIAIANSRVMIAVTQGGVPSGYIRALNAQTGATLWDQQSSAPGFADVLWDIETDGVRTVTSAFRSDAGGFKMVLRSYDAASGALHWEVIRDRTAGRAKIRNGAIYVAGLDMSLMPSERTYFAAFDFNGNELWTAPSDPGHFNSIDASSTQVVAAGPKGLVSRALDGRYQWWRGIPEDSVLFDVAVTERAVYAGGSDRTLTTADMMVQIYDPDGNALSDSRFHHTVGKDSSVTDLAVAGSTLVLAGGFNDNSMVSGLNTSAVEGAEPVIVSLAAPAPPVPPDPREIRRRLRGR